MNEIQNDLRMRAAIKAVQGYYPKEDIALLVFMPEETGPAGDIGPMVNYIGTMPREDMLAKLKIVLGRWEGAGHGPPSGS